MARIRAFQARYPGSSPGPRIPGRERSRASTKENMQFKNWYDKNYKKLLVLPAIVLLLSFIYLGVFYIQNKDIIHRDVTLTGGTTITIFTDKPISELEDHLADKLSSYDLRALSDNTGKQNRLVITAPEDQTNLLKKELSFFLGEQLNETNSSQETTSAALSTQFYNQLIVAVLLAFFWMAAIVFIIFAKGRKIKLWVVLINIILGFFLGMFFLHINIYLAAIIFLAFAAGLIYIYIKSSVPAFAVMLSAFADITMTLALVNILGFKISTAGIVAFLMLIGYSVDTDILLTTRMLKRGQESDKALFGAFKTGTTMTLTSIIAITAALIIVYSFGTVLNQIFSILIIGLSFDLFNTWITNASLIKWYVERNA